jgi:hypothetical protein
MIQAILNWGVAMESWVTTPATGANITWLQNMSLLVSQLCGRVAHGDTLKILVCQTIYVISFGTTWIWDIFYSHGYTMVQMNLKKNTTHKKNNTCAERWVHCVSGTKMNGKNGTIVTLYQWELFKKTARILYPVHKRRVKSILYHSLQSQLFHVCMLVFPLGTIL